ncbi:unnamed protein product, partial [Prorocentrum cordatum]
VLFTLCVFIIGTGGLKGQTNNGEIKGEVERITIFCCRCFIYLLSLGQWLYYHIKYIWRDVRAKSFVKFAHIPFPAYLENFQDCASLLLTILLLVMLGLDPLLHCLANKAVDEDDVMFRDDCDASKGIGEVFSTVSAVAAVLYFALIIDLSVFSTRVSAFVLVCYRVLSEALLFLFGLAFMIVTWSTAVSALDQDNDDFAGIPASALSLLKIALGMYSGKSFALLQDEPALMAAVVCFVIVSVVFLSNLLIAQLNCSYQSTYLDMVGYARLNRGKIVTEAMSVVTDKRWRAFLDSLCLDERCEFGEGDIGLAGGIQIKEAANVNITTVDMIRRFGGSTSVMAQWPEDDLAGNDEEDRFERMEKLITKAMKRMNTGSGKKGKSGKGSTGASSGQQNTGSGTGSGQGASNSDSAKGSEHESDHSDGE